MDKDRQKDEDTTIYLSNVSRDKNISRYSGDRVISDQEASKVWQVHQRTHVELNTLSTEFQFGHLTPPQFQQKKDQIQYAAEKQIGDSDLEHTLRTRELKKQGIKPLPVVQSEAQLTREQQEARRKAQVAAALAKLKIK